MTVVAALMAVFFIMQLVGQAPGRALGHFRRGLLSLGRDHDWHFACRIWHSAFTRPGNYHLAL